MMYTTWLDFLVGMRLDMSSMTIVWTCGAQDLNSLAQFLVTDAGQTTTAGRLPGCSTMDMIAHAVLPVPGAEAIRALRVLALRTSTSSR